MLHFDSDYMNICHPLILQRMQQMQDCQMPGYGTDPISQSAREKVRRLCQCPDAEVQFLCGGTQTNMVMVNYLLRSFEGVLSADSAHVAIHESGAIEFTGHKVLTLPSTQGKITAEQVDNYVTTYYTDPNWPHIVPPGMVYITHPTEYGTLYTLSEMEAISAVCRKHHLPLYLDGARLGYGLGASGVSVNGQWAILNAEGIASGSSAVGGAGADFKEPRERSGNYQLSTINSQLPTLPDIARLCDAFYIGGTKCGTMFGEAAIIPRPAADSRFFTHIKRHGALIAKGWTTALQFDTLLEGDTLTATPYYQGCRHAIVEAMRLRQALIDKGYRLPYHSPTNQQFVEVSLEQAARLKEHLTYDQWEPPHGDRVTIRFATSWATRSEDIDRLIDLL